jgi:hypothetical protein
MSITFKLDHEREVTVDIHTDGTDLKVRLHEKSDKHDEFVTIGYWDFKSKEKAQMYFTGDQMESLLEQVSKIAVLRFKSQT